MAFPTTGLLDDFNRADEGPPPSASWSATAIASGTSFLRVASNTCASSSNQFNGGGIWGTTVGPDSEVYLTLSTMPPTGNSVYLWLRLQESGATTEDGYACRITRRDDFPGARFVNFRVDNNALTQIGATVDDSSGALAGGAKFGADVVGSVLTSYLNTSGTWTTEASFSGDTTYGAAGGIALAVDDTTTRLDDFSGGTVVTTPSTDVFVPHFSGRGAGW